MGEETGGRRSEGWGWRIARQAAGWASIVLGVVAGFIPILQGWVFILMGLSLLAPDVPWARRTMNWLKERLRRKGIETDTKR